MTVTQFCLALSGHLTPRELSRAWDGHMTWEAQVVVDVVFLDSFDWRLAARGAVLTREHDGREDGALCWQPADGPPHVLPFPGRLRFAADLPDGSLRAALEPLLETRAVLEMGACRVWRTRGRITDADGNLLALLRHEEMEALDGDGTPREGPASFLHVQALPEGAELPAALAARIGADPVGALGPLELAAAARGRRPGDYSSKPRLRLDASQPAGEALRALLLELLDTLQANIDGVVEDLDTEFLHDLRVAARRSRSALRRLDGALPADPAASFAGELKWLGTVTGPLRDLDVYLLGLPAYRELLGEHAASLAPLERLLRRRRAQALGRVRRALRSARFQRFLSDWRSFLEAPSAEDPTAPDGARPVAEVVGPRILAAHRRILKRGRRLGDDPPARLLHRLRIAGKRLRYLLELFASLYPADELAPLVSELKELQDILGGINDMEVQQARLLELAESLLAAGDVRADTLLAMGRLAAALEHRQLELRASLEKPLVALLSPASRRTYQQLFGGG